MPYFADFKTYATVRATVEMWAGWFGVFMVCWWVHIASLGPFMLACGALGWGLGIMMSRR